MRNKHSKELRKITNYKVGHNKTAKTFGLDEKGFLVVTNPEFRLYKELKKRVDGRQLKFIKTLKEQLSKQNNETQKV